MLNVVDYRDPGVATSEASRMIAKINLVPNQRDDPQVVAMMASHADCGCPHPTRSTLNPAMVEGSTRM